MVLHGRWLCFVHRLAQRCVPIAFHIKAEAIGHGAGHKNEFAIFSDELYREGNLLAVGRLFCLQFFERQVAPDGLYFCHISCFWVKIKERNRNGKNLKKWRCASFFSYKMLVQQCEYGLYC